MAERGTPYNWNVVVNGAWNLAILNPLGVARRLFGLEALPSALQVEVSVDRPAPIRVMHDNLKVIPSTDQLIVEPSDSSQDGLLRASSIAARAIESLPETPLRAARVNVRYRFDSPPDELDAILQSKLDDRLAESSHKILDKTLQRSLEWREGVLNVELGWKEDISAFVHFNFHRASSDGPELRDWLAHVDKMIESSSELLESALNVPVAAWTEGG